MADDALRDLERALEAGGGWSARQPYVEALRRAGQPVEAYRCLQAGAAIEPEALAALEALQGPVLSPGHYSRVRACGSPPPIRPRKARRLWGDPKRMLGGVVPSPVGIVLLSGPRRTEPTQLETLFWRADRLEVLEPDGRERCTIPTASDHSLQVTVEGRCLTVVELRLHHWTMRLIDLVSGVELANDLSSGFVMPSFTLSSWGMVGSPTDSANTLEAAPLLSAANRPQAFEPWLRSLEEVGHVQFTAAGPPGVAAWGESGIRLFSWSGELLAALDLHVSSSHSMLCDAHGVVVQRRDQRLCALSWLGETQWVSEEPVGSRTRAIGESVIVADVGRTGSLNLIDRANGKVTKTLGRLDHDVSLAIQGDSILFTNPGSRELIATDFAGNRRWAINLSKLEPPVGILQSPPYETYLGDAKRALWTVRSS